MATLAVRRESLPQSRLTEVSSFVAAPNLPAATPTPPLKRAAPEINYADEQRQVTRQVELGAWQGRKNATLRLLREGKLDLSRFPEADPARLAYGPTNPAIFYGQYGLHASYTIPCQGGECDGLLAQGTGPIDRPDWSLVRCIEHGPRLAALLGELGWEKRVNDARIPQHFLGLAEGAWPRNLAFSDVGRQAFEWAQAWVQERQPRSVLFSGAYGIGKTALATWMQYQRMRHHGERGVWTTAADLMRSGYPNSRDRDLPDRAQHTPILLLDDLGVEKPSSYTDETFYRILSYRHGNRLPTLVTTNLPLWAVMGGEQPEDGQYPTGSLEAHLGLRIANRFYDSDVYTVFSWSGPNLRLVVTSK